ncbi:hypothetical protein PU683_12230 [Kosakonia cowanii]|uniref:hypothetical protein n=1 Tax=Kosakonia cowanii TaxID=208223 RepID=UPI0023FA2CD2|nr:hypothetical protein [Kosakonia cowanii]MDF7760294.1 hypothetical protein [Kosakonia cowanii]
MIVLVVCCITDEDYNKYRKEGVKTEAKIINKEKIGASGSGNTRFRMLVEFATKDGVARVTAKRFFTPEELIKIMRRNTVVLYYMPQVPQRIVMIPFEME